ASWRANGSVQLLVGAEGFCWTQAVGEVSIRSGRTRSKSKLGSHFIGVAHERDQAPVPPGTSPGVSSSCLWLRPRRCLVARFERVFLHTPRWRTTLLRRGHRQIGSNREECAHNLPSRCESGWKTSCFGRGRP